MKTWTKAAAWLGVALVGWLTCGRAEAANPAYLNIDVAITANLSVAVNGQASSTQTVNWNTATANAKLVSAASATVTNDSGGQTEKWALSTNPFSINVPGVAGSTWTLKTATTTLPGADEFAVQAVFGSSNTLAAGCPLDTATDWDRTFAPALTSAPVTYSASAFSDIFLTDNGTPNPDVISGGGNGRMFSGSKRALCWRVITPNSTSTADTQNVQVIVTAQNP